MPDPMNLESTSDFSLHLPREDKRCSVCGRRRDDLASVLIRGTTTVYYVDADSEGLGRTIESSTPLFDLHCLICEECRRRIPDKLLEIFKP